MRELPLLLTVPAGIVILGLIWYLRSKDDKKKPKTEKDSNIRREEKDQSNPTPKPVEKEGITLTQRKLPDSDARERGSGDAILDDLNLKNSEQKESKQINSSLELSVQKDIPKPNVTKVSSKQMIDMLAENGFTETQPVKVSVVSVNNSQKDTSTVEDRIESVAVVEEVMKADCVSAVQTAPLQTSEPVLVDKQESKEESLEFINISKNTSWIEDSLEESLLEPDMDVQSNELSEFKSNENMDENKCNVVKSTPVPILFKNSERSIDNDSQNTSHTNESDYCTDTSNLEGEASKGEGQSSLLFSESNEENITPVNVDTTVYEDSAIPSVLCSPDSAISEQKSNEYNVAKDTSMSSIMPEIDNTDCMDSKDAPKELKEGSPKSASPALDSHSEGSNDSGRGISDHEAQMQLEPKIQFDFNMPSEVCGRFIGKQGKNINHLKVKTGANVSLTYNPFTPDYQICQVAGSQQEIDQALNMIRKKFPLKEFPHMTMVQVNQPPAATDPHPVIVPDVMQLSIPEGVSVEVYVSAVVDGGRVFVQQPTHRSFMSLEKLNYFLNSTYSQDPNIPSVPTPLECGVICVCENDGAWYRAMIMSQADEANQCQIKFVDYGGYTQMPVGDLKQIRQDFMALPFQAVECMLANVTTLEGEQMFSDAAGMSLCEMTSGKLLQCQVVARTEAGMPHIHLYTLDQETQTAVLVNRALVSLGLVRWVELH